MKGCKKIIISKVKENIKEKITFVSSHQNTWKDKSFFPNDIMHIILSEIGFKTTDKVQGSELRFAIDLFVEIMQDHVFVNFDNFKKPLPIKSNDFLTLELLNKSLSYSNTQNYSWTLNNYGSDISEVFLKSQSKTHKKKQYFNKNNYKPVKYSNDKDNEVTKNQTSVVNKIKPYHFFDDIGYVIENKKRKKKDLIKSEIIKPLENFVRTHENGLFLSISPTGSGKSFQTGNLILNEMLENPHKKILFITDRVENVKNPYESLIKEIEKNKNLTEKDKDFLKSKIIFVKNREDSINELSELDVNLFFDDINRLLPSKDLNKQKDYLIKNLRDVQSLKKITYSSEINEKCLKESIDMKVKEFAKEIKDVYQFFLRQLREKKLETELSPKVKKTLSTIYAADAIELHQVIFMTTKKALCTLGGAIYPTTHLEELKNFIIFIDEFSAQKTVMENIFIEVSPYVSNIQAQKILNLNNIELGKIKTSKLITPEFKEIKNLLKSKKFIDLNVKKSFKYELEGSDENITKVSIFFDGRSTSCLNKNNSVLSYENSKKENLNKIIEKDKKNRNKNDKSFLEYNKELNKFIDDDFTKIINKMIKKIKEEEPDLSLNPILVKIFAALRLEDGDEKFKTTSLFNRVFDNLLTYKQSFKFTPAKNDIISGYLDKIRITKLIDRNIDDLIDIQNKTIKNNSNLFMLSLCQSHKVIGLSATAFAETNIENYDLIFLKNNLPNGIQKYSDNELKLIKKELDYKYNTGNVKYDIRILEKSLLNRDLISNYKMKNLNISDYNKNRLSYLQESIDAFKTKKHSRYMMAFFSKSMAEYNSGIQSYLDENGFEHIKVINIMSEDLKNEYKLKNITKHLQENKKNKIIITTTYQTASSGLNLQRTLLENERESFYCLNNKFNFENCDIDTVYLDNPTQNFVEGVAQLESDFSNFDKIQLSMLIRLKELSSARCISKPEYKDAFKILSHAKTPNDLKLIQSKYYNNTFDEQELLLALLRQSIGRIIRTNNRCLETNIYIQDEFAQKLTNFNKIKKGELETKEMMLLIDVINNYRLEPMNISEEDFEVQNEMILASKAATSYFSSLLGKINKQKDVNKIDAINAWERLRSFVLKNGAYLNKTKTERLEFENTELDRLIFYIDKTYSINKNGSWDYPNAFKLDYNGSTKIDETFVNLDLINKNLELKNYFDSKGYALKFEDNIYSALAPNIVNNIYKGAIGEELVSFISNKYGINLVKLDEDRYEKVDFLFENNKKGIGFDAKNWNPIYQDEEHLNKFYEKANTKLELFDKLVYINVFDKGASIKYTDENGFESEPKNAKIILLSGLYSSEDGSEFINTSKNLLEVNRWINT